MALVCDIKSDNAPPSSIPSDVIKEESTVGTNNEDLEDGEIEDDDEDEQISEPAPVETAPEAAPVQINVPNTAASPVTTKFNRVIRADRSDRHNRYDERKRSHLTEAEKSVMHLHKMERLERLEREKRERYKREQTTVVDDFASNIEKAIASVLRKDKKGSDNDKEDEDKRGKKRKKKDKDKKKSKQRKLEEVGEKETLNVQSDIVEIMQLKSRSSTPRSDYESYDSSASSDHSKEDKKDKKKKGGRTKAKDRVRNDKKFQDRNNREQKAESLGMCIYYLQGKCNKGNECPYSHEVARTVKLELCKFYLMECCAKGDKCLYMHSEFPCKFYHTGLACYAGDNCKFAHGKPLEDGLRQILFKHIETAPKEILGDFPRLGRDDALNMINQTQKNLEGKYSVDKKTVNNELAIDKSIIPSLFEINVPMPVELLQKDDSKSKDKGEKPMGRERNRPSRWQDADPSDTSMVLQEHQKQHLQMTFGIKGFYSERGDQDMRTNSNGDIDMRTLIPQLAPPVLPLTMDSPTDITSKDVDIRNRPRDTDIRQFNLDNQIDFAKDIDIRQIPQFHMNDDPIIDEQPKLQIVVEEEPEPKPDISNELPVTLPKKQRELFLRIQAQQKENVPENQKDMSVDEDHNNIDWYSDDDDECRLTIGDDIEETKVKTDESSETVVSIPQIPQIKPVEILEKLGDLSKIDISADVTKLLSSISQSNIGKEVTTAAPKDPRTELPKVSLSDPRRARSESQESKETKNISIYEQGSISIESGNKDVDLRNTDGDMDLRPIYRDTDLRSNSTQGRSDVDLRQLSLPFKAMQNYTPASEIDASINMHAPIKWRIHLVEIPRPDYTGLKLSSHEAQNTGDPRLRKIFRLSSTEEKDSPASPKESPKASTGIRVDPRRRKMEEKAAIVAENVQMSYSQQLNILQTSAFYQSLTSNQKVLLNQELASKSDHSGSNDPTLNGILSNLGLLPGPSTIVPNMNNAANTSALNILTNINNMNSMMVQNPSMINSTSNQPFLNQQVNPNILTQNPNVVNQMTQSITQPVRASLLGTGPGVPSLPPDFQLNFDPRQGGLLGNAPPFNNYNDNSNYNYNEEYYEEGNNFVEPPVSNRGGGRGGRGNFRDRQQRRGRNFRNGGRNFRNRNRSNRSRTPP